MGDALVARYWCYMCSQMVSPVMEVDIKCPFCESGFLEEMDGSRDQDTDLGSDRALSLWAPILLGMMGGGGGHRHRRLRREPESEEDEEELLRGESERERDLEAIIRRRRRSSAAVLHLLQGLRTGLQENSESEREREHEHEHEQEQERVILVNPFNQAIILQGSFDLNQNQNNQNQNQNQAVPGSLGDYLIGPGLDLLLQHLAENDPNRYGSPPTKKEAVEAMPTVNIEENLQCSVCLDDFEIGAEAKEMPCKHKFHDGCILPWLELHSSCPVCRFQMPAEEVAIKVDGDGSRNGSNRVETNNDGEGGNGNGRRTWLSIPWPFNGLFSLSRGSQSGGGGTSSPQQPPPPSSSAESSQSSHQADDS